MIAQPPFSICLRRVIDGGVVVDGVVVVVRPRATESFVPEPSIEVTAGAFGGAD